MRHYYSTTHIVLHVNVLTEVCMLVLPLTGFGNVLVQMQRLITARREMMSNTYKTKPEIVAYLARLAASSSPPAAL